MANSARMKTWVMNIGGGTVGCTACCWSKKMKDHDIGSADKEFEAHICSDYPPKKDWKKSEDQK